ncbi:hypothetical protein HDE_07428 [Halotydeus destructor]|nr:hypothetical protein HDE_07428 [Halotydeus destructor]
MEDARILSLPSLADMGIEPSQEEPPSKKRKMATFLTLVFVRNENYEISREIEDKIRIHLAKLEKLTEKRAEMTQQIADLDTELLKAWCSKLTRHESDIEQLWASASTLLRQPDPRYVQEQIEKMEKFFETLYADDENFKDAREQKLISIERTTSWISGIPAPRARGILMRKSAKHLKARSIRCLTKHCSEKSEKQLQAQLSCDTT